MILCNGVFHALAGLTLLRLMELVESPILFSTIVPPYLNLAWPNSTRPIYRFPLFSCYKFPLIQPTPKKGYCVNPSNYPPIALIIYCIPKVFESIFKSKILKPVTLQYSI